MMHNDCETAETINQCSENVRIRRIEDKIFSAQNGWTKDKPGKSFTVKNAFQASDNNPLNHSGVQENSNEEGNRSSRYNYKNQSSVNLKLENTREKPQCAVVYNVEIRNHDL